MPRLVEVQRERLADGLFVVGITSASLEDVEEFAEEYEVSYPLLANAERLKGELGVSALWGSVVYLVNPEGTILVEGLEASLERLETELGDQSSAGSE